MLRFSLLARLRDNFVFDSPCWVFPATKVGGYVELWVRCGVLRDALSLLEQASSWGPILAFAGLDGRVVRSLPPSEGEFLKLASSDLVVDKSVEAVFEVLGSFEAAAAFLMSVSTGVRINAKGLEGIAVLTSPVRASAFFDSGVRLLRPFESPPRLIEKPRHPQTRASKRVERAES